MDYKIVSIMHSGTLGTRMSPRVDGRYPQRVGRIVDLDISNIREGKSLIIRYIRDSNGADYDAVLVTSIVKCFWTEDESDDDFDILYVETLNSIFKFEKV